MSDHNFSLYWIVTQGEMSAETLEKAARYDHVQRCGSFDGGANRKVRAVDWHRETNGHHHSHIMTVMAGVEALRHVGWIVKEDTDD